MTKYKIDSNKFGSTVWMRGSDNEDWIFLTEFWGEGHRIGAEHYVDYMVRMDRADRLTTPKNPVEYTHKKERET